MFTPYLSDSRIPVMPNLVRSFLKVFSITAITLVCLGPEVWLSAGEGDPLPGSIDPEFQSGAGPNDDILSLRYYPGEGEEDRILVAGFLTQYDGVTRQRVALLDGDGVLEESFDPGAGPNGRVDVAVLLDDGKVLIGGAFTQVGGVGRNRIARLNADGSLDTGFDPGNGADWLVTDLAVQSDGATVVAGGFQYFDGQPANRIARLNPDGSLDGSFQSGSGFNGWTESVVIDGDGRILVGGNFTQYQGIAAGRLVRLESDGNRDNTFDIGAGFNGTVRAIAVDPENRIVAGGDFTVCDGNPAGRLARLSTEGELIHSFLPEDGFNNTIHSVAFDKNGWLVVGGNFTEVDGMSVRRIARLNPAGTIDTSFDSGIGPNNRVNGIAVQPTGRVLIGGAFSEYDGAIQRYIARLVAGDTSSPHNEGSEMVYDSITDTYTFSWMGLPGYYYFVQYSEDLENWEWVPIVEPGFGERIEYGFASNVDRFFLRLIYTFDPQAPVMQTDFNDTRVSTWDEIQLGTNPFVWVDSTGNGLPDAWELYHFGELGVDPNDDPDGDGLTNYEEYLAGTDPNKWDTSGDLLSDGWKVDNGLNPLDPNDDGLPSEATDIVETEFTIGDPSGSHSEQWRIMIQGEGPEDFREIGFHNEDFGAIHPETVKLRKGNGYRITLSHVATNESQGPDYDWQAQIDGQPTTDVLEGGETHEEGDRFFVVAGHWIVDNTDGLLGEVDPSFHDVDHTVGKEAWLIPVGKFRADDGKIHHGFSPPNTEQEDDSDVYWASVIQNETNNIVNFIAGSSEAADLLELHIPSAHEDYVDISPKTFTGAETSLTITGTDAAGGAIYDAEIHMVLKDDQSSNPAPLLVLNVMVLPKRTIPVAIYTLEDPDSPATQFDKEPMVTLPTNEDTLEVLDDVFLQAGVQFTLHPSSGTLSFKYDTKPLDKVQMVYLGEGEDRDPDGRVSFEEYVAFFHNPPGSAPADGLFEVDPQSFESARIIWVKESGYPYDFSDPEGSMIRGAETGMIFTRNLPNQVKLAAAHEVGHQLGLSFADDDGGAHDQPPYPLEVEADEPLGIAPQHPGDDFPEPHRTEPNRAIMQSGAPTPEGLPWMYGRWMQHRDWKRANEHAEAFLQNPGS